MKLRNLAARAAGVLKSGPAKVAGGLSALAMAGASSAAIDVTSVTTALTDAGTAVATVGAAVLVVIVGVAAYKYIRRAL